ncbi:hypothetical protein F4821DRAFT_50942 [Hypoxylon rubiginosum]|uniref:Uncharacterized protein n=1 Tax=Hypoxylon rubiginosum TaxID=110542 RepID=A0ACC0DAC9_9PEZI|nr:hypothetical protein F4821DRAFT_50942 [Hypoxylon rubiginosum]
MATIEPRLIHLLNESTATPRPHHAELPPIKVLPLPKTSGRLHPIEPDASQRSDVSDATGVGQLSSQSMPSLYSMVEDGSTAGSAMLRGDVSYPADRALLSHISSQDLRMILDDAPDSTAAEDLGKKRRPVKEDFVQLPQPLKKQKAATQHQQHMFPPIIVGLVEPPSDASLFPPISSGSFDSRPHSEPPQALSSLSKPPPPPPQQPESTTTADTPEDRANPSSPPPPEPERTPTGKVKRRAAKPRRKWSEEETNHLLLGVSKHGVGRWTDILEDPEYRFNDRTAGDLKDRFRTCCPEELRASPAVRGSEKEKQKQPAGATTKARGKPRKGLMSENILNETEEEAVEEAVEAAEQQTLLSSSANNQNDSSDPTAARSQQQQRKSRAHRKKMEDLAELGIRGPFKKSHRRERRPFSERDDREILEGFELYGPQWTKIQRDPRFNLSTRQPTDLRDRLRNKYPERFAGTEKTAMQVREPGRSGGGGGGSGSGLLEPSVNMAIENSLQHHMPGRSALLEPQLNRTSSKEDMPRWPLPSSLIEPGESSSSSSQQQQQSHPGLYWNEGAGSGFTSGAIGEMDISRLLLDDTQASNDFSSERRGLG